MFNYCMHIPLFALSGVLHFAGFRIMTSISRLIYMEMSVRYSLTIVESEQLGDL